jgi:hypothetical protein
MNYVQLSEQIQAFVENTFPDTGTWDARNVSSKQQIDQLIKAAEQRIYNSVQFPSLRKNVLGALSMGNKYLSAPSDFLSVFSMAVVLPSGEYVYLINKDVNYIREAYPSPNSVGVPKFYALFGPTTTADDPPVITNELSLVLGPTPDAAYPVELHYNHYPTSITASEDGHSWLGDNFDTVLLYGALVEAAIFMKAEADMMTAYQARYAEALSQAKRLGDGMQRGDTFRNGQFKQPVT